MKLPVTVDLPVLINHEVNSIKYFVGILLVIGHSGEMFIDDTTFDVDELESGFSRANISGPFQYEKDQIYRF